MRRFTYIVTGVVSIVATAMSVATLLPFNGLPRLTGLGPQEFCFQTPYPAAPSQCGCPTNVSADFCEATKPLDGSDTTAGYYCLYDSNYNCTPNGRSCGGLVYVCLVSRCNVSPCQDSIDNDGDGLTDEPDECYVPPSPPNSSQCSLTSKTGYCTNSFGCTDTYVGGGGGYGGPPL